MKKILMIIGSPKKNSFNKAFSKIAADYLSERAAIEYLAYQDLPFMSPDIEHPRPASVARVMKEVADADGLWIFASEYNLGCAAVLKNLLDWLSRPVGERFEDGTYVTNKKVTLTSVAGRSAGKYVLVQLNQMLSYMGMTIMKEYQTGVGLSEHDFIVDEPDFQEDHIIQLKRQADAFCRFLDFKI